MSNEKKNTNKYTRYSSSNQDQKSTGCRTLNRKARKSSRSGLRAHGKSQVFIEIFQKKSDELVH